MSRKPAFYCHMKKYHLIIFLDYRTFKIGKIIIL